MRSRAGSTYAGLAAAILIAASGCGGGSSARDARTGTDATTADTGGGDHAPDAVDAPSALGDARDAPSAAPDGSAADALDGATSGDAADAADEHATTDATAEHATTDATAGGDADATTGGDAEVADAAPVDPLSCASTSLQAMVSAGVPSDEPVAASCGSNPSICCTGGTPISPCTKIEFDFTATASEPPRLQLDEPAGTMNLDVTVRAKVRALAPIPINIAGMDCQLTIDSTPGATPDLEFDFPIARMSGADGHDFAVIGTVAVNGFTSDDMVLGGSIGCSFVTFGESTALGLVAGAFDELLRGAVCDSCPCM